MTDVQRYRWGVGGMHSETGPRELFDLYVSEADYAALTAEVEALRRDAERVAFLDTVSVAIHVRNGRRYEAGPGNARDIIDAASAYNAARHQEALAARTGKATTQENAP